MGRKLAAIGFVTWSLIAMPALCVGGAVGHPCDCGTTSGCSHESDCENDPCSGSTARVEKQTDEVSAPGPAAPLGSACGTVTSDMVARLLLADVFGPPSGPSLPYRDSDIPLLI
jgi:hypothetical protein